MQITPLASGSSGNAYRVDCAGRSLLLECGLPFKKLQRALDFNISALDGVLISHEHQDHAKAVREFMKAGVDCFMSLGTSQALGSLHGHHRAHIVEPKKRFYPHGCGIGAAFHVMPFETQHDAAEPLGFLIASAGQKLLYATDTFYLKYRFEGLTHIMLEVNYADDILTERADAGDVHRSLRRRIAGSHMSLATAVDFFKANDLSQVREIWLLHLSDGNSDAERFKREIQETTGKPVMVA
jgi:phosphoribosyl 1,2-cyclic phosphodiesterase